MAERGGGNVDGIAPLMVSKKQAARMMGISIRLLERLIRNGQIVKVRIEGRVLIPNAEIVRYLAGHQELSTKDGTAMSGCGTLQAEPPVEKPAGSSEQNQNHNAAIDSARKFRRGKQARRNTGTAKKSSKKNGRPSNVSLVRGDSWEPITPFVFGGLNDTSWLHRYASMVTRVLDYGEDRQVCAIDLGISTAMGEYVECRLESLLHTPVAKHFRSARCFGRMLPPTLPKRGARWNRAKTIGVRLLSLAKRDPHWIRQVVDLYCNSISTHKRFIMTDVSDASRGQQLIGLINDLNLSWLGIRAVGFCVGAQKSDPEPWLRALGLPPEIAVHYVNAPNSESEAALHHFGIEVVNSDLGRVSGEFHVVMIYAQIVAIWRLVSRPPASSEIAWHQLPLFDATADQPQ